MPDDPQRGPLLDIPWRAAVTAGAVVVVFLAVFAGAVWVFGTLGGTPSAGPTPSDLSSSPSVVTAPTSGAPSGRRRRHERVGDPLQPVRLRHPKGCPIRPPVILHVMQFNIHAGVSRFGGLGIARIAAEIKAAHPDLVSLNEVDDGTTRSGHTNEPAYLAAATGLHPVYGPNLFGYDDGRFGNAILSRYPVLDSRNTHLPVPHGIEARGLLEATIRVGHRTIAFFSVHLTQGRRRTWPRVREADAVARVVRAAPYPVILAGDLNSRPTTLPVRILRQYLLDAQEYGGHGLGLTVPEGDPVNRIDYVLYDNHFAVVPGSTQVLPSASSDHRSVWTELVLRSKDGC